MKTTCATAGKHMPNGANPMKKGRAHEAARPQPTIYGNCDSWDLIVGKKRLALCPNGATREPLSHARTSGKTRVNRMHANPVKDAGFYPFPHEAREGRRVLCR
ncbi:MAG: hypothetical protein Q4G71_08400 [Pseudomonadota bacterium]|nr:hypothetical protein [Pseudomonadota bacterium]